MLSSRTTPCTTFAFATQLFFKNIHLRPSALSMAVVPAMVAPIASTKLLSRSLVSPTHCARKCFSAPQSQHCFASASTLTIASARYIRHCPHTNLSFSAQFRSLQQQHLSSPRCCRNTRSAQAAVCLPRSQPCQPLRSFKNPMANPRSRSKKQQKGSKISRHHKANASTVSARNYGINTCPHSESQHLFRSSLPIPA